MQKLNNTNDDENNENENDEGDIEDGMGGMKYTTTKKRKAAMMNDFYKFQLKDYKK